MKHHLAEAQRGDADAYDEAWEHAARDPHCRDALDLVATLAADHAQVPRQPAVAAATPDTLRDLARAVSDEFHAPLAALVKLVGGGTYLRAETKDAARIAEKALADYGGDVARVVDVERATASFAAISKLREFLREVAKLENDGAAALEIVR